MLNEQYSGLAGQHTQISVLCNLCPRLSSGDKIIFPFTAESVCEQGKRQPHNIGWEMGGVRVKQINFPLNSLDLGNYAGEKASSYHVAFA